jgi:hypothetical protein
MSLQIELPNAAPCARAHHNHAAATVPGEFKMNKRKRERLARRLHALLAQGNREILALRQAHASSTSDDLWTTHTISECDDVKLGLPRMEICCQQVGGPDWRRQTWVTSLVFRHKDGYVERVPMHKVERTVSSYSPVNRPAVSDIQRRALSYMKHDAGNFKMDMYFVIEGEVHSISTEEAGAC